MICLYRNLNGDCVDRECPFTLEEINEWIEPECNDFYESTEPDCMIQDKVKREG